MLSHRFLSIYRKPFCGVAVGCIIVAEDAFSSIFMGFYISCVLYNNISFTSIANLELDFRLVRPCLKVIHYISLFILQSFRSVLVDFHPFRGISWVSVLLSFCYVWRSTSTLYVVKWTALWHLEITYVTASPTGCFIFLDMAIYCACTSYFVGPNFNI